MIQIKTQGKLYERDFVEWCEDTIAKLKAHRFSEVDEQSPSLRSYLVEVFPKSWSDALFDAREDYPQVQFPNEWAFSFDIDALVGEKLW